MNRSGSILDFHVNISPHMSMCAFVCVLVGVDACRKYTQTHNVSIPKIKEWIEEGE